jgi:hypothetical protein
MARTFEEEERIKKLTALQASMPQWLSMQSTGASALGDMFGFDTENIKQFGKVQEKALEGFSYKRPERLLKSPQPFDWWKERAALNSMNTIAPMLGFAVGNLMRAMPHPIAKLIGTGINWGTMAMTYNMNLADTLEEHEQIAGRELTTSEKQKAALVSIGVSALDLLVPIKGAKATSNLIAKTFGRGGVQNTRKVLTKLVNTSRDSLLKQVGKGASFSGKLIATEMGTEAGQKALQMGTSVDPGKIGTPEGMQDILEEAVIAGPTVGIITAPGAVGVAREQNRDISTAQRLAKQFNTDVLRKESPDSEEIAKDLINIPENDSDFKKLAKQGNKFIEKVTGVDLKKLSVDVVQGAAFKPLAPIIKLRNEAKTGAEFHAANNLYQMFAPTGTGSGEQKTGDNFFGIKETKTGEYLGRVSEILDKYATTFAMGGSFGKRFDPAINDYLIQAIKGEPITVALPSNINRTEIDADVRFIKSIIAKAHKDLKSSGVAIGWIENYLTNPVSKSAVKNNIEGFVTVLMEASKRGWEKAMAANPETKWTPYTEDQARRIADEIVNGIDPNIITAREALEIMEDKKALKKPGFEKSRSAAWEFVDEVAEEMGLGSFREQNIERVLTEYLQKAATRVASARVFGDKASLLEKELKTLVKAGNLTPAQRDKVYDVYDAAHNVYKKDTSKNVLAASKVATTIGAATHLALATISSITELAWVGERAGFWHMLKTIPKALRYSLEGIRKGVPRKYRPRGEMQIAMATLGFNIDPRVNERLDQIFSTDHNAILGAWFRSPLGGFLTQWTNFNRNWAAQAMISNINSRANARIKGNISDVEKGRLDSELRENGVSYEDFDTIVSMFRGPNGLVKVDITNDTILDTVLRTENVLVRPKQKGKKAKYADREVTVRDILVPWLHKVVDDVVVHPKATNKPLWMSDPKLAIIAQLKTFPIVFGNTVVKRLLRKLNPKQCSPDYGAAIGAVGGIAMAYALVHIGETMKAAIRQTDFEAPGMRETLDRAGLTGALGLVAGAGRFHQGAVTSLGGTAIGAVDRVFKDFITPMYTGTAEEKAESFPNLTVWLGESLDAALGPAGIYFKPFEED